GEPLDLGLRLPDVPLEFAQPPPRLLRDLLERAADDADAVRHLGVLLEPARRLLLVLREGVLRQALRLARNLPRASPETLREALGQPETGLVHQLRRRRDAEETLDRVPRR